MRMSQRVVWIFSNSYILRKNSFLERKPKFLLASPIIFIYGLLRILQFFFLQKSSVQNIPDDLIILSAAPHMHKNYFKLFDQDLKKNKYLLIDSLDKEKFTQIKRLNFLDIYKEFYLTFKEVINVLSKLNADEHKTLKIYEACLALPVFAYFACLFKDIKMQNSRSKIFSGGAHTISSAGITACIPVYWLAHGLIAAALPRQNNEFKPSQYFIALPDFQCIYLYSQDEIKYLEDHGIESQFRLYNYKKLNKFSNKVIIFLDSEDRYMNFLDLSNLIDMFNKYKYMVIVKFHPSYEGSLNEKFFNNKGVKILKDHGPSASQLMLEERPRFVSGWLSTIICEAYMQEIVPICLATPKNSPDVDLIYDFKKKSISWHDEKELLEDCITIGNDAFKLLREKD